MKYGNLRNKRRKNKLKKNRFLIGFGGMFCIIAIIAIIKETAYTTEVPPSSSDTPNQVIVASPDISKQPIEPVEPAEETPTDSPTPIPEKPTSQANYNYAKPIPVSKEVGNDYFNDAIFIGDSRTEGFILYSGISNTTSYTGRGLSVKSLFTSPLVTMNEKKVPVIEALKANHNFSKVYIMFGVNELGWVSSQSFIQTYGKIIDIIKTAHPDVVIYVQSIIPVTMEKSNSDSVYNNTRIKEFNALLQKMAKEKQVYFVNVSEALVDRTGCLPADYATDGVHLKPNYYKKWFSYLKTHAALPKA